MAVSFVAASSGSSAASTSTSFVTTLPTGWAAGDVAVLVGHLSTASLTMSTPAGWTAVPGITNPTDEGTNSRIYAWYRLLQAGDTAPTITNSGSVTGGWAMAAYRGADQVSPIGQAAAAGTAAVTSRALPSLTGVLAGSALHAFAHARVATGTIPTGLNWNASYTEALDVATSRATSQTNMRFANARRLIAAAGNYGGETVTVANTISSSMISGLIEIKPAGSTPSTVTLTPASFTMSAAATSPAPQPVTVALTAAALTLTAVAVTAGTPPPSVTLTPAAFSVNAVAVSPAPMPVTVALTPAALGVSAVAVSPVPKPVTVTLAPTALALSAPAVTAVPKPVTVTLTPAVFTLSAVAPAITSASGPSTVTLTPAVFSLSPVAPTPTPRAVNRTLTPAVFTLTAVRVTPTPLAVAVTLTPAVVDLAAVPVDAAPQPATVTLTAAEFTLDAAPVDLRPIAGAHTVFAREFARHVTAKAPTTHVASGVQAARVAAVAGAQASVRRSV